MSGTYIDNQGNEIIIGGAANNSFKANINLDNINATARQLISTQAMPSNRYIDLTLLASGSTYTAPANGYYVFSKYSTAGNQYYGVINTNNGMRFEGRSVNTGSLYGGVIQAKKNDVIQVAYGLAGNTEIFRFIYAEGESNV